jgi:hypothetical protein
VVIAALVLVFLLIFILQNPTRVSVFFLGAAGTLPLGAAMLFAAIAGAAGTADQLGPHPAAAARRPSTVINPGTFPWVDPGQGWCRAPSTARLQASRQEVAL